MKLRQIQAHHFRVLVMLEPVAGDSVLDVLADAKRFHYRLFESMTVALRDYTPVYGPPFRETRLYGAPKAKRLYEGISEFIAENREAKRRDRAKQPKEEKNIGLRVFFFEYGRDVICTNACYKTSMTPEGAIPSAFRVRDSYLDYLANRNVPEIIEEIISHE